MRQILYYLPKASGEGVTRADVLALGITWLLDEGKEPVPRPVLNNGPDGGTGVVFAREDGKHPHVIGYHRDRQTWEKAPGCDYWVGYFNDAKPGPEDLARGTQPDKHPVRLRDGNKWIIPPVRLYGGVLNVPFGLKLDESGSLTNKPLPEYAELLKGAEAIWNWQNGINEDGLGFVDLMRIIALALGRVYRIGLPELNLLELLDTENAGGAALAITDYPTFQELKKNDTAATSE